MESTILTSNNMAFKALRKVTSMVLPRLGTSDDFKFASEEDIKALRTMISMLTVIQQVDQPVEDLNASELVHPPLETDSERRELKVLSALATVLVMEHEVVAVVAKHDNFGNLGTGGVVEVVAFTDGIVDKESESPKSFFNNFIAAHNPRISDKSKSKLGIHNQAEGFENLTQEDLLKKFRAGTKKERNKLKVDDFLHHADMLSGFLPYSDELLDYVVVACFRKILYRVKHSISEPFLKFLDDIAAKSASSSTYTGTFPRFENITLGNTSKEYQKHSKNDIKLFDKILLFLLRLLQDHNTDLKFPRLEQAVSTHVPTTDPIKAYNEDTYIEYHLLLVELLRLFKLGLLALENLDKTQWHSKKFIDIVWYVTATGDALQAMAGGNMIKMHMKVITAGHDRPRHTILDEEVVDDDCQRDHELFKIINTFPTSLAFCNWLKLIVVHFDAVRILITYMEKFQLPKVTIKVVITPNPDKVQLSWKELLGNEKYFQKERLGHPTATMITEFIEDSQDAQKLTGPGGSNVTDVITMELKKFSDCSDSDLDSKRCLDLREIISSMNTMASCLSPGSEFGVTVKQIMKSLKDVSGTPADKRLKIEEIITRLEELKDSALSFSRLNLNLKDLPSSSFKGSIHCELNLACFKMLDTSCDLPKDYKRIADELLNTGPVIGVSKPCCPVCMRLLTCNDSFIVRGFHQTLSPCTLPKWAPESVAHDAIAYYSGRLREALERLMKTSIEVRRRDRVKSTQSDRLSLDSHEDESKIFATRRYKDRPTAGLPNLIV